MERQIGQPMSFRAERQPTDIGSYARLPVDGRSESVLSFACRFCTLLPAAGSDSVVAGTSRWSVGLDARGRPFAEFLGIRAVAGDPVAAGEWFEILAVIEAAGRISLTVRGVAASSGVFHHVAADCPTVAEIDAADMLLAARPAGPRRDAHFNGKIERPRLVAGEVTREAWPSLMRHDPELPLGAARWIGAWDFSRKMQTREIVDVSGKDANGSLHQLPMRAVTGSDWDGTAFTPNENPRHYAAIAFHSDDIYDANWPISLEMQLDADLPSGVYALRLESGASPPTRVVFFVRRGSGQRPAPVAFLASTATFLAYANYRVIARRAVGEAYRGRLFSFGPEDVLIETTPEIGASAYDQHPDGTGVVYSSPHRPILNLQPDTRLSSFAGDMFVLAWLEHLGIGVDIVTDEDLHRDGIQALSAAKVVVTGGHPEYHSTEMLDALETFLNGGGRLMYLGGNGFYWRIAHSPHWPGAIELRRPEGGTRNWESAVGEGCLSFDGKPGGLWRRLGRTPNRLTGVGFTAQGFDRAVPYRRRPDAANPRARFLFAGVDDDTIGDHGIGFWGAAGQEVDRFDISLGSPRHALVVASSAGLHTDNMVLTPEDVLANNLAIGGTENPLVRADLTFFETPAGGAVFSAGSISWPSSLPTNGFENNVARVTENALRAFLSDHRFSPENPYSPKTKD